MELAAIADLSFDPRVTFLGGGPVIPRIMLVAFRELSQRALAGGYQGVRILADMDWLLPGQLAADEIARLEVVADRAAREPSATIICAYRRTSFDGCPVGAQVRREPEAGEQRRIQEVMNVRDLVAADFEHLDRPRLKPAAGTGLVVRERR
jgi:MEDS: MEthanogen/methylotroph, DcmR Sensory domain